MMILRARDFDFRLTARRMTSSRPAALPCTDLDPVRAHHGPHAYVTLYTDALREGIIVASDRQEIRGFLREARHACIIIIIFHHHSLSRHGVRRCFCFGFYYSSNIIAPPVPRIIIVRPWLFDPLLLPSPSEWLLPLLLRYVDPFFVLVPAEEERVRRRSPKHENRFCLWHLRNASPGTHCCEKKSEVTVQELPNISLDIASVPLMLVDVTWGKMLTCSAPAAIVRVLGRHVHPSPHPRESTAKISRYIPKT